MTNKFDFFLTSVIAVALTGCASTTIFPEKNNQFSLVTTSSSEGVAEKEALKKAEEYCAKRGQNLVVLEHQSTYQGVDKTHKALIGLTGALLTNNQMYSANSDDDYRVNLRFTCH